MQLKIKIFQYDICQIYVNIKIFSVNQIQILLILPIIRYNLEGLDALFGKLKIYPDNLFHCSKTDSKQVSQLTIDMKVYIEQMREQYFEWLSEKRDEDWSQNGREYFKDYVDGNDEFNEDIEECLEESACNTAGEEEND